MDLVSQRAHLIDWLCDWCWTYDPRNSPLGLPTTLPFVPWPKQVEYLDWILDRYIMQSNGLVEKSRDAGATWLSVVVMVHEWRWSPGFAGGIGSNKLLNVDQKDNVGSIFAKIRQLLEYMPVWWLPKGFDRKKHDKIGNLVNPELGTNIIGQGGDDIGRGDRRAMYLVDEAAHLEHPENVDAALSQTTTCQIDLSTPKGMNHFGKKRHSGRIEVFTFNWRQDPRKGEEWYSEQKASLDAVILAQEVDCSYHASVEGVFVDPKHVQAAINMPLEAEGLKSAGLDVAEGGKNRSSLAIRTGPMVRVSNWNYENGVDLSHRAIDECNKAGVDYLNYDKIGCGFAVRSTLERTEMPMDFECYAVNAGDAASDRVYTEFGNKKGSDVFINARAEWWYLFARRFEKTYEHRNGIRKHDESEMISIENDGNFIAQISGPKKLLTEHGKIKCESKESMFKRGIESPDMADGAIMAFIPQDAGKRHLVVKKPIMAPLSVDFANLNEHVVLYCSQWVDKSLKTACLLTLWNAVRGHLYVFYEALFENPRPELVTVILGKAIKKFSNSRYRNLQEFDWIGNELMFKKGENDLKNAYSRYNQAIMPNPLYNDYGSVALLSRLIQRKALYLDERHCVNLAQELNTWTMVENKPEAGYMSARALCNLVSMIYETGRMAKPKPLKPYSKAKMGFNKAFGELVKQGLDILPNEQLEEMLEGAEEQGKPMDTGDRMGLW